MNAPAPTEITKAQRHVEVLRSEREKTIALYDQRIEQARDVPFPNESLLADLEAKRSGLDAAYADYIQQAKDHLESLKTAANAARAVQLRQDTEKAQRAEASEKVKARAAWLNAGGDPDGFEQAWPSLWQQKLQKAVTGGDQEDHHAPLVRL